MLIREWVLARKIMVPNNHERDVLKLGILTNFAVMWSLQWYLFQGIYISLVAEFLEF